MAEKVLAHTIVRCRASLGSASRIFCEPLMRQRSNLARPAVMVRMSVPVEVLRSKVSPFWASTALIVGGEDMVLVALEARHHIELCGRDHSRKEVEHASRQR